MEDSKAFDRLVGPEPFTPRVERYLRIQFPRIGKIVCVEDQRLPFRVENPSERTLTPAVTVPVVYVDNVEIAGDDQITDVASPRHKLLPDSHCFRLLGKLLSELSQFGFFH